MATIKAVSILILTVAALLGVGLQSTDAAVILYSDRAAWNADVPSSTTIDFQSPTASPPILISSPPGFEQALVSFNLVAGSDGALFLVTPSFYGTPSQVLSSQVSGTGLDGLAIALGGNVTAVALDFDTLRCVNNRCLPGETVSFGLSSGDTFTRMSVSTPNMGFVGLTSSTAFDALTLTIHGTPGVLNGVLNVDNFSFGPRISVVPEPSTFVLLVVGLVGAAGYTRSCRRP